MQSTINQLKIGLTEAEEKAMRKFQKIVDQNSVELRIKDEIVKVLKHELQQTQNQISNKVEKEKKKNQNEFGLYEDLQEEIINKTTHINHIED